MAIEILSVSLSDESIERLANRVIEIMSDKSGSDSPETRRTQPAEVSGEEADPWSPAGSREARDATIAGPAGSRAARPAASAATGSRAGTDGDVRTVKTKFGVQTWRFPPDAPRCDCGEPAGLKAAVSQSGKPYKAWNCAKAAGDDWRDKCDFNEFTR